MVSNDASEVKAPRKPAVRKPLNPDGDYRLTVLSYERRNGQCPRCSRVGILYVCHGFALPWPDKIREYCKPCAIEEAGGEGFVALKTTVFELPRVWARGTRPPAPKTACEGSRRKRQSLQQNAYSGASSGADDR